MITVAQREHENLEEKLRELMAQDKQVRARHDKLVAEVQATEDELSRIATAKMELMTQLGGLYKKHATGNGRRKQGERS